jgi:hypothetical protein
MRKLIMATLVTVMSVFASLTMAKAAPIAPMTLPYEVSSTAIKQNVIKVHRRSYRHSHRRRYRRGGGIYIGPGGVYVNPGYGYRPRVRHCRRWRRRCRNRWGGGSRYRRCMRRQGCRRFY